MPVCQTGEGVMRKPPFRPHQQRVSATTKSNDEHEWVPR